MAPLLDGLLLIHARIVRCNCRPVVLLYGCRCYEYEYHTLRYGPETALGINSRPLRPGEMLRAQCLKDGLAEHSHLTSHVSSDLCIPPFVYKTTPNSVNSFLQFLVFVSSPQFLSPPSIP